MSSRYEGKSFLRLLELYVLWAVNRLPEESRRTLEEMAPKLQRTYDFTGTWQAIIEHQMEFPPETPQLIRGVWEKNEEVAHERGEEMDAQRFAEQFVDANFR